MSTSTFRRKCDVCGKEIEGTSPTAVVRNLAHHKATEHRDVKFAADH
jgi:hypothetical protein